ncbi:MAG TPA: HEAT repeat domain-containing protein [Candidatus Thermoplasmatota archaeon]|nr:HEAT repeat domain-containing protein [Candidatus Thermoplasmatota archaeon]
MGVLQDILKSSMKPKEKQAKLVAVVCDGTINDDEFIKFFRSASDVEKGVCADVMKHVAEEKPEILAPYMNILVGYINYPVPRVKWGIPEAIGNMAEQFPDEVVLAIPHLLLNTKDDSTVVRWCAAYALSQIALYNTKKRKELLALFSQIVQKEKNNGVKNVYLKTLKKLSQ